MHRHPVPPLAARTHNKGRGALPHIPIRPPPSHRPNLLLHQPRRRNTTTKTKRPQVTTPPTNTRGGQQAGPPLYLLALVKYNPSAMATSITMTAKGLRPPLEGSSDARETFSLASFSTSSACVRWVWCVLGGCGWEGMSNWPRRFGIEINTCKTTPPEIGDSPRNTL